MYYKCPLCGCANTSEKWNRTTISNFGAPIEEIENSDRDCFFICPDCLKKIDREDIEKIENKKEKMKKNLLALAK